MSKSQCPHRFGLAVAHLLFSAGLWAVVIGSSGQADTMYYLEPGQPVTINFNVSGGFSPYVPDHLVQAFLFTTSDASTSELYATLDDDDNPLATWNDHATGLRLDGLFANYASPTSKYNFDYTVTTNLSGFTSSLDSGSIQFYLTSGSGEITLRSPSETISTGGTQPGPFWGTATSSSSSWNDTPEPTVTSITGIVPEPSTLALLAAGTLGLVGYGWRRRWKGRLAAEPTTSGQGDAPATLSFPSQQSRWSGAKRRAA